MRMEDHLIRCSGGLGTRAGAEGTNQSRQGEQPSRRADRLLHASLIGQGLALRRRIANPPHRNAIERLAASPAPVGRCDDPHVVAAVAQREGERMEKGAGQIAGMAGIVVGHEDNDHA